MAGVIGHLSEKTSILPPFRSTDRSCENLHLKPFVHCPCRKYSHNTDLGSVPAHCKHYSR